MPQIYFVLASSLKALLAWQIPSSGGWSGIASGKKGRANRGEGRRGALKVITTQKINQ